MQFPFTDRQFFDAFGAYNATAWPFVVVLWLVTFGYAVSLFRGSARSLALSALMAVHWLWSGVVYHALFFTAINPAAWLFAVMFVLEGVAFAWFGVVRRNWTFTRDRSAKSVIGVVFVVYSLAYPLLVVLSGHQPPRAPLFAVPCPTTLFTTGLLLMARPMRVIVMIVPAVWAAIGGTAAIVLGVTPDFVLFAAAVCLVVYGTSSVIRTSASTARSA